MNWWNLPLTVSDHRFWYRRWKSAIRGTGPFGCSTRELINVHKFVELSHSCQLNNISPRDETSVILSCFVRRLFL